MHKATCLLLTATLIFTTFVSVPAASAHHRTLPIVATPLLDLIDIVVRKREVIAIDPHRAGGTMRTRLMVGEDVEWVGARGSVGVVITNKRVLGITTSWRAWQETRLKVHEGRPSSVLLGDRVALVITDDRAIGISTGGPRFFETLIGLNERLVDGLVSDNVAVLLTDRRLLGVSGFVPGVFTTRVGIHEDVEFVSSLPNFVTIGTDDRVIIFRAPSGSWNAERVALH